MGEWTNRLHDYFEKEHKRLHNGEVSPVLSNGGRRASAKPENPINAVELFNEQVNIGGNSNGPEKLTESKISPLVTHSSNGLTGQDHIRRIQS